MQHLLPWGEPGEEGRASSTVRQALLPGTEHSAINPVGGDDDEGELEGEDAL